MAPWLAQRSTIQTTPLGKMQLVGSIPASYVVGELQNARWLFQAVPLQNGSALAAGGLGVASGGVLNSTELFIPNAKGSVPLGSWKKVAEMNTPRQDFELLALNDGKVLALGGFMSSVEIYDPQKDAWTRSQPMGEARSSFQALVLSSGKVLAIGGRGRESGALASSELFDPSTETWTPQGMMSQGRAYFAAVECSDGKVMVAGGKNEQGINLNSTEVYDPETGKWSQSADMIYHRSDLQAVATSAGQVLVVGGLGGRIDQEISILDTAEVYEPQLDKWALTYPMVAARYVFQLVPLSNMSVMALGGTSQTGYTSSTETYGGFS